MNDSLKIMVAVITGDIIGSRMLGDQNQWIAPFKKLLASWEISAEAWKVDRGDFFQIEIAKPEGAFYKLLEIKVLIKKIKPVSPNKKASTIDVRMAVGIGEKKYSGSAISESNGPAFINSGEKFDTLRRSNLTAGIKTPWPDFDEEMNLLLNLGGLIMDNWTVSSAELVAVVLQNPHSTQEEIGQILGIKQNSVSGRFNRAHVSQILEIERMFRKKIKQLSP